MTVQEALKVEASMPAILAVNESMYKKAARESGFQMPEPHHPKNWNRPETVAGYEMRFYNWLHKLNHHLHCKALDANAAARKLTVGVSQFKTGCI